MPGPDNLFLQPHPLVGGSVASSPDTAHRHAEGAGQMVRRWTGNAQTSWLGGRSVRATAMVPANSVTPFRRLGRKTRARSPRRRGPAWLLPFPPAKLRMQVLHG